MSAASSSTALAALNNKKNWLHQWIYFLTAGLMYAAVFLRAVIGFQNSPQLGPIVVLLTAWALVFIGSVSLTRRSPRGFTALIGLEILITLSLLLMTHSIRSDLFAFLFAIIGMQVMQRQSPRVAAIVIGFCAVMTFLSLFQLFGVLQALALTLIYTALSIFLAAYVWATRQSQAIQEQQQALTGELQDANQKLELYSRQAQQLAATRERQRLARELHDSVTQTIFSMTLAVQTARMSMQRDRQQVATQLDRLDQLSHNALTEMQELISKLTPEDSSGGFADILRQHLAERERLENLSVELVFEGDQILSPAEQSSLYRIAQEALNNIVKHAQVSSAVLRLHLTDPMWMEIEDHGVGFIPENTATAGKIGLAGMCERAAEIGWSIQIQSIPGRGTTIRVWKGA